MVGRAVDELQVEVDGAVSGVEDGAHIDVADLVQRGVDIRAQAAKIAVEQLGVGKVDAEALTNTGVEW